MREQDGRQDKRKSGKFNMREIVRLRVNLHTLTPWQKKVTEWILKHT